jgi:thiol:disulfide interchange protein
MSNVHSPAVLMILLVLSLAGCGGAGAGRDAATAENASAGNELLLDAPEPESTEPAAASPEEGVQTDPDAIYSTWTTFAQASRESRANGKPVLLAFNAGWASEGQALQQEVFDHAAAGTTVKAAVIPVLVVDRSREDGRNSPEVEGLIQQFQVDSYPTLIVFSPASGRAARRTGYRGADEMLRWITESATIVTAP